MKSLIIILLSVLSVQVKASHCTEECCKIENFKANNCPEAKILSSNLLSDSGFMTLFMGSLGVSSATAALTDSVKKACLVNAGLSGTLAYKTYKHKMACQVKMSDTHSSLCVANLERLKVQLMVAMTSLLASTGCAAVLEVNEKMDDKLNRLGDDVNKIKTKTIIEIGNMIDQKIEASINRLKNSDEIKALKAQLLEDIKNEVSGVKGEALQDIENMIDRKIDEYRKKLGI